jgi:hypothetical protein
VRRSARKITLVDHELESFSSSGLCSGGGDDRDHFEALAIGPLARWSYAPAMPTLPILGTGVVPLLQLIVLPPLTIWFVRRQLA